VRRLLVLCYFFPPHGGGGVHRVLGFTRHLPDHGWDCSVVCAGESDYWITDERLRARVSPRTEVVRVPGGSPLWAWLKLRRRDRGRRPERAFGLLRRLSDFWLIPDPYVTWAGRCRAAGARLLRRGRFDAMLSTSPPDSVHLAASSLRERFALPWVADFRDPWMGLYHRPPPTAWHAARQAALERRVLRTADLVTTATRAHARDLEARSEARPRRVAHIPNGFEPHGADAAPEAGVADAAPEPGDGKFLIVFTGTLAKMPEANVFLEALHELLARRPEARRRLRAKLAGPYETGYADRAVALGLTPGIVEFLGSLAYDAARELQRRADLLVLWKMERMDATVPGKLYEYLDSGRPVLAALGDGDEAAALLERAGGACVPPGARAALAEAIERRYLEWRQGGRAPSRRPEWLEALTRARLAAQLAAELDRVCADGAAERPMPGAGA